MPSNRLIGILLATAGLAWLTPMRAADTSVQWGADRTASPWSICLYDSANVCQPIFTLPATGGGPVFPITGGVVTTVAGLATAFPSPTEGQGAYVTDAVSCVFGAGLTGGGSGVPGCTVHYNGSAWTAG